MKSKIKTVSIIGDKSNYKRIMDAAENETLRPSIVLFPCTMDRALPDPEEHFKWQLRDLQKEHIRLSDEVIVINDFNGATGRDEIDKESMDYINFAHAIGVPVYLENPHENHPVIITMIGSHKFIDKFRELESEFAMSGIIALPPYRFSYVDNICANPSEDVEKKLDELHRIKMKGSRKVLVVNPGGYIGEDTLDEIQWAIQNHIEVEYLETPGEEAIYGKKEER